MKTWLFALLQSLIAALGLAAYFLADNYVLASAAAVAAALLGVAQPLISAQKGRRLQAYQDGQYQKSVDAVDNQVQELLAGIIEPPFPHDAAVAVSLRTQFAEQEAPQLIGDYQHAIQAIQANDASAGGLAAEFGQRIPACALGPYLQGLAALAAGELTAAHDHFRFASQRQSSWILPWLGWATSASRLGRWDEIRSDHPHLRGVELLPYDAGDERTFLRLTEEQRAELTDRYQSAATSLGGYYTIAELMNSKQQMAQSRAELSKVA